MKKQLVILIVLLIGISEVAIWFYIENIGLKNKVRSLSEQLSDIETQYSHLKNLYDALSEKYDSLSRKFSELESNYTSLKMMYNELKNKYTKLSEEHISLIKGYAELRLEILSRSGLAPEFWPEKSTGKVRKYVKQHLKHLRNGGQEQILIVGSTHG